MQRPPAKQAPLLADNGRQRVRLPGNQRPHPPESSTPQPGEETLTVARQRARVAAEALVVCPTAAQTATGSGVPRAAC